MNPLISVRPELMFYGKAMHRKTGYVAGQLEITSKCSQKCFMCDSWKQHQTGTIAGTFKYLDLLNIFRQLSAMSTFEHLTLTGGDPQNWTDEALHMGFDDLLRLTKGRGFTLQVNTALMREPRIEVWRTALDRVRVSLDAIDPKTYRKIRGVAVNPEEIVQRMERLAMPGLATMTCVSLLNIDEIGKIIERLNRMAIPPRKAMFLAVLEQQTTPEFWAKFRQLKEVPSPLVQTSFAEDVVALNEFKNSAASQGVRCWVGNVSFHIKCNGDVYPCCLVGGEAVSTQKQLAIGNVLTESLDNIYDRFCPHPFYYKGSPCVGVCQWKQVIMNLIGEEACRTKLTMP